MLTQRIYETMDRKTHVNFFLEINQRSSSNKFDFVITLIRLTAKLYIYIFNIAWHVKYMYTPHFVRVYNYIFDIARDITR